MLVRKNIEAELFSTYIAIFDVSQTSSHLFVSINLLYVLVAWPAHSFPIALSALFKFNSADLVVHTFYPVTLSISFLIVPNITFFGLVVLP